MKSQSVERLDVSGLRGRCHCYLDYHIMCFQDLEGLQGCPVLSYFLGFGLCMLGTRAMKTQPWHKRTPNPMHVSWHTAWTTWEPPKQNNNSAQVQVNNNTLISSSKPQFEARVFTNLWSQEHSAPPRVCKGSKAPSFRQGIPSDQFVGQILDLISDLSIANALRQRKCDCLHAIDAEDMQKLGSSPSTFLWNVNGPAYYFVSH